MDNLHETKKGRVVTKSTWDRVMALRAVDTRHKGLANTLTEDEIETVAGTVDYFGANWRQVVFDLKVARYRVFDFLAMCVGGRLENDDATKVLVYSFLKVGGDIDTWITDLRETDYDIDHSWTTLSLDN